MKFLHNVQKGILVCYKFLIISKIVDLNKTLRHFLFFFLIHLELYLIFQGPIFNSLQG